MDLHQSNLEESVIKRTVCILGLGLNTGEQDVITSVEALGQIQYVRVDPNSSGTEKVALVQYEDEQSAEDLVRQVNVRVVDRICKVRPSSITIEVIPPTDAVFGKPMTVGRHVMAVNISKDNRGRDRHLSEKIRKSHESILAVLERVSVTSGWRIPDRTIQFLKSDKDDRMTSDSRAESSRTISRRSSRSRSRSSRGAQRNPEDRIRSHRRR